MNHYVEKVAICYYNSPKAVVRRNHVEVMTNKVELYSLDPKGTGKHFRKPLFNRV